MKARIFISYSRRNKEFTQRLVDELKRRGYDPWVDWDDIPFSVDWWNEIQKAINDHDVVVTVVSYHSLVSRVVNKEIKYARDINKRIIPVIVEKADIREVVGELYDKPYEMDARDNYKYIRTLNWIYFYRPED
ncbi:MAG: toll/interleukin-1 receptor domain-containing protein, partial [Chloroflexota bacterium]